jgi:predicted TIM-barrel fold metal-dependent hydrolase
VVALDGIAVIDTLIGLPAAEPEGADPDHGIGYMFKAVPRVARTEHSADDLLRQMDTYGIEIGLVPVFIDDELSIRAVRDHPDRLLGSLGVDPNQGVEAIGTLARAVDEIGVVAAQFMPADLTPPVAINDPRAYPVYAKCVELDIPIFVNGGVPGPAGKSMRPQHPALVDDVATSFPELRFVFRHGCEPWVDLTVELLLKYPNVYYSTSGFAPRYYPKAIIDFANTQGADKILYAGYYPYGLELERIFRELPGIGLKDEVWPKFLRANAARVLKLDERRRGAP